MNKKHIIISSLLVLMVIANLSYIFNNEKIVDEKSSKESIDITDFSHVKKSSQTKLWNYSAAGDGIRTVDISSNGTYMVAGSLDNNIYMFNNTSSDPMWIFPTSGIVRSVAISDDGEYIAACGQYNQYYFHRSSPTPLWTTDYWVLYGEIAITSNGSLVALARGTSLVLLDNLGNELWESWINAERVDITPDGNYIGSNSLHSLEIRHKSSKTAIKNFYTDNMNSYIQDVKISDDGYYIAGAYSNYWDSGSIYLFNQSSGRFSEMWNYETGEIIHSMDMSADGKYLVTATSDLFYPKLYFFEKSSGDPQWIKTVTPNGEIYSVAISDNGDYIIAGVENDEADTNEIHLYDKANSDPIWIYDIGDGYLIYDVAISSEGLYSFAGSEYIISGAGYPPLHGMVTLCYHSFAPGPFNLSSDAGSPDTDGSFNLNWQSSSGAENYSIYQDTSYISDVSDAIKVDEGIESLTYPISGLTSRKYYFKLVAFNELGNISSNCIEVNVQIPPRDFTLTTNADNPDTDKNFNLTWEASIGADNYSVYESSSYIDAINGLCTELTTDIEEIEYEILGHPGGTYYYIIEAHNETGKKLSNCIQVNVSYFPDEYLTKLTLIESIDNVIWGNNMTFSVNFSYSDDGASTWKPIINPNAYCNLSIKLLGSETVLYSANMTLGMGNGNFTLIINSSRLSAGDYGNDYSILIEGYHPIYMKPVPLLHYIQVKPIPTNATIHDYNSLDTILDKSYSQYYNELINITIRYSINESGIPIKGATLTYDWLMLGPQQFYEDPLNNGYYTFTLNTLAAGVVGTQPILISASLENYTKLDFTVYLQIQERPTDLNGESGVLYIGKQIWAYDTYNFSFAYNDSRTLTIIGDLDIASYSWQEVDKDGNPIMGSSGTGSLIQNANKTYTLDFDTETRNAGYYRLNVNMKETNYDLRIAQINLNISKIPISINGTATNISISKSIIFGNSYNFTFEVNNTITNEKIGDLDQVYYCWYLADSDGKPISDPSENINLIKSSEECYILDFNSEEKNAGYYLVITYFCGNNYEHRNATILFKVNGTASSSTSLVSSSKEKGEDSKDNEGSGILEFLGSPIGIATVTGSSSSAGIAVYLLRKKFKVKFRGKK